MAGDSDFVAYVQDCLAQAGLGPVMRERLFSGSGFRIDGEMFAVILRGTLYFVVDDQTRPRFEVAGMGPFTYARKTETRVVPRWYELPEDVLLDNDELRDWMREALAAVRRTSKPAKVKTAGKTAASRPTAKKAAARSKAAAKTRRAGRKAVKPAQKSKTRPAR